MTAEELIKLAIATEPCPICNAKPGEKCASLVDASKYYDATVHARRREAARKGSE